MCKQLTFCLTESWLRNKAIYLLVLCCKCLREKQQHGVGCKVLVVCVCGIRGGRVFCSADASCIAKLFCQSRNRTSLIKALKTMRPLPSEDHSSSRTCPCNCLRPSVSVEMSSASGWQTSCRVTARRSHAQPSGRLARVADRQPPSVQLRSVEQCRSTPPRIDRNSRSDPPCTGGSVWALRKGKEAASCLFG